MITVDHSSPKPLYEQIVENFKELVVKGILIEGDAIPSVRKLALMIEVNPNTISKAYRELEHQNIIKTIPARGAFVAKQNKEKLGEEKTEIIKEKLKPLLVEMKFFNLKDEEILDLVNEILKTI